MRTSERTYESDLAAALTLARRFADPDSAGGSMRNWIAGALVRIGHGVGPIYGGDNMSTTTRQATAAELAAAGWTTVGRQWRSPVSGA